MNDEFVDRLSNALAERFELLAGDAVQSNPRVWHGVGRRRTTGRGLECWVAFNRSGRAGGEDLVVFFGYARFGRGSDATIDVSTGEGAVLADGPAWAFTLGVPRERWLAEQDEYLDRVDRFLEEVRPIVGGRLR